jgi:inosine-uridine nucleoside N-ribohydrolase
MTREQYLKNLEPPKSKVDVILDTDTYNEVDDQYAMSYLLHSLDKVKVVGITAVPFFNSNSTSPTDGMEKSYEEIMKLLELDGKTYLKDIVYRGAKEYLPDENTPIECDAARFIAESAKKYSPENPLYVVAIGAGTNVASAILMEPDAMRENTVIVWLAGHAKEWPDTAEFNMRQDIAAARVIFGCGAPLVQLPCMGVVSAFTTSKYELIHWLEGKSELAEYLLHRVVDEYTMEEAWSRCLWDVTAVAWVIDGDKFMKSYLIPAPIPQYDNHYSFDPNRHLMRYVYHIRRDRLFTALFTKITE